MDGPMPGQLHVYSGWSAVSATPPDAGRPAEAATSWFARESLRPPPRAPLPEAFTREWFEAAEQARHGRQGAWMPRILEFGKHPDETLLALGDGLGTDWVAYARHRTRVIVACPDPDQLTLVRRNFESRGLPGQFVLAPPAQLPLPPASVDVVQVNGMESGLGDVAALAAEAYRVLRPGGKVLVAVPAHYDVTFWKRVFFPWRRRKPAEGGLPSYTAAALKKAFDRFGEHRVHKRHLRRSELPHVWRFLPLTVMERLVGRVLVLKAFKPLSAAIGLTAAA
jgi:SAM-dependent methyltransferase